jgi:hypothetical protein
VASSPKGTLAVAAVRAALDVPALLPGGATAPNGWATTATGIDVLGGRRAEVCPAGTTAEKGGRSPDTIKPGEVGPTYCFNENAPDRSREQTTIVSPQDAQGVTASYTWEQLGISGDVLRAARGELVVFFAEPGTTDFERVDIGSIPVGAPLFAIAAEDGFDIVKSAAPDPTGRGGMSVLHSPDGRAWTPATTDNAGTMAFASYAGLLGATPVVFGGTEEGGPVMMRRDGDTWTTTDLSSLVSRPADTAVYIGNAGVGAAGAVLSVMVVEVETKDGRRQDRGNPVNRLLTTRDGVTWHDQAVDDLAGTKTSGVSMVAVTGDRVVVTAILPRTDATSDVAPRITLIGTPR